MSTITAGVIDTGKYLEILKNYKNATRFTMDIYSRALAACEVSQVDTSNIPGIWAYLLERLKSGKSSPGFVSTTVAVVRSALKFEGIGWVKDGNYNTLLLELNRRKGHKDGYTDDDIRKILNSTINEFDGALFRACVLMSLSGLRIGACEGLKFSDMKQTENGVWVFVVTSKTRTYMAALSDYGRQLLDASNWREFPEVVTVPKGKTPFHNLLRSRMNYLMAKNGFRDMMQGKSIFHSMRHWALTKMSLTLHSEDVALLAGHAVANSTAMKYYINPDNKKVPLEWEVKVSKAYYDSPLNSWRIA